MQLYDRNNSTVMIVAAIVIATVLISSPVIAIAFLGCRNFNAYFSESSKQSCELIESSDYYPFISQEWEFQCSKSELLIRIIVASKVASF